MKLFVAILLLIVSAFCVTTNYAENEHPGKKLFYSVKGKYGTCNHCHKNGGTAGRWDFEYEELSNEDGKKIPSLKGLSKRKSIEQIERSVSYMKKMFGFKLTEEEVTLLAEYVASL